MSLEYKKSKLKPTPNRNTYLTMLKHKQGLLIFIFDRNQQDSFRETDKTVRGYGRFYAWITKEDRADMMRDLIKTEIWLRDHEDLAPTYQTKVA